MTAARLQHSNNTALVLREDQVEFDDRQVAALTQLGVSGATKADLAVFFHQCRRTGLDPFARQIYMIERQVWNARTQQREARQTIQTGIDGFRLIARRADRNYSYDDTLWCGTDGVWRDVWTNPNVPPYAAKVTVVMGNGKSVSAVANFMEYAATKKDPQGNLQLTGQWGSKPVLMIAKCAEALGLRKAYPQDLSGIYTEDEMAKAEVVEATVVVDGQQVPLPEPSGRDWAAELDTLQSATQVRDLYRECAAFKELTTELRDKMTTRAGQLPNEVPEPAGEQAPDESADPPADITPEEPRQEQRRTRARASTR